MREYTELAKIYDHLMEHVDYDFWALYIDDVLKKYFKGRHFDRILDCSCGTGNFLSFWQNFGSSSIISGDLSLEMLKRAKYKFPGSPLVKLDMKRLPFNSRFDLILSLYDSFNYLLDFDQMREFFESVNKALVPDGVLIFDITTVFNSRKYFNDSHSKERYEDIPYERYSYFDEENMYQFNQFQIYLNGETIFEEHKQRVYHCKEIEKTAKEFNLKKIAVLNNFSFKKGSDRSERVHFVYQKKGGLE